MKSLFKVLLFCFLIASCKTTKTDVLSNENDELVIAFGSCNKQNVENVLWKEVLKHKPSVWIWGGDNIYSDTDDMEKLQADYNTQLSQTDYKALQKSTKILGTWDDHDYGLNDGGEEFHVKKESQQLFLDFMGVSKSDKRRQQEGVYHSESIKTTSGSIKVIVLDTRYFRTTLTKDKDTKKRYKPNKYGEGTVLGEQQWNWLENELKSSRSDFNLIVSSIQFLSSEHGYETWGNFPHEVDKLKKLIQKSNAKGVLLLSGDRHISEFSKIEVKDMDYPLIDFTSSGLTHAYNAFKREPNKFREGEVVHDLSFGLIKFNFKELKITMEMRGVNNVLQQKITQDY